MISIRILSRLLTAVSVIGVLTTAPASAEACSESWNGKYSGYVTKMYVPEDQRQYGRCNDYGRWAGTAYKGYRVPGGSFWVYKYPYWYVWRSRGQDVKHRSRKVLRINAVLD